MNFEPYYKARDVIDGILEKDLVGPLSTNEEFSDTDPLRYYSMGILYPQGYKIGQEESEKDPLEDETTLADQALNLCNSAYPSSFGMSFTVKAGTGRFRIYYSIARYQGRELEEKKRDGHPHVWSRMSIEDHVVHDCSKELGTYEVYVGLKIDTYLQRTYYDGSQTYTVVMINTNSPGSDMKDNNERSFFQSKLWVMADAEDAGIFVERKSKIQLKKDPELLNLEMLYRHQKSFAAGHGCSVDWISDGPRATQISTSFLPRFSILQMRPPIRIESGILSWHFLANSTKDEVSTALGMLTSSYQEWILDKREESDELDEDYKEQGTKNLDLCDEALSRIEQAIELFNDEDVFVAFQLANQVMLNQRLQGLKSTGQGYVVEELGWYPFQLAFMLHELASIVDPNDRYRDIVDLLWFPTGGGKTEAYLGLSAFTVFYRRIRSKSDTSGAGVSIIMRYTLRLLTLQQFQRAATMVCAAEIVRRGNTQLFGTDAISIGLWVGGGLTPNSLKEAVAGLENIRSKGLESLREGDPNPCQVLTCPWCGRDVGPMDYQITKSAMVIKCPNRSCEFHSGLPMHLVDEEIYVHKPTLIVSTIDKFARMTWEPRVGELFGLMTGLRPPELIIQDELHLISGPLGTIAGLYELAIEYFCSKNLIIPKIIASTATIRNAKNQILSLYGRDFRQFPPQGIDIRDSYFAEEVGQNEAPARKYVGVMSPGKSGTTMFVRIFAALLYATRYLKDLGYPDEVIDSFWTITGYFNSLKQLGGAMVQVLDDVQARFKYLYGSKFRQHQSVPFSSEHEFTHHDELTSRKSAVEIGKVLKNLEIKHPDRASYDYIMASNMLSVGVDVGRLGLMLVNGQPKSNAEYIQATSRVGRRTPGLVVILQDSSRSRDRSHYEQFRPYHSSIYKYVEATSITPFSERARDRALHAVLISLCRHLIPDLRSNEMAGQMPTYKQDIEKFIDFIIKRVKTIDPREAESTNDHVRRILEEWESKCSPDLVYQRSRQQQVPLLVDFDSPYSEGFPTLNSMRSVDTQSKVYLEG